MKRRQFIQNILLSGAALGYWSSGIPFRFSPSNALAAEGKTVIKVFQRGGCDGLNMVVPYAEDRYYQLRPTIAIPRADSGQSGAALDLNGFFGFHPSMTGLRDLYQQGNLAIMPATHYPQGSRSHFTSQHYIESGQQVENTAGWMNRHMQSHSQAATMRAVSVGNDLVQALRGDIPVTTLNNFNNVGLSVPEEEEAALLARLQQIYQHPASELANHQLVHQFGTQMLNDIGTLASIRDTPYVPENGAIYPNSGLARQLQLVARIIKADVGLELANVNIGGWDNHSDQGGATGRQANRLDELSTSLSAFYQDMGGRMSDVALLVGTEFGRTSEENGSFGTDHGFASAWMLLSNAVNGGIYGQWPGLEEAQLERGRFLAMSTDYRDIYADILTGFLGNTELATVLPGHNHTPIGLF